MVLPSLNGAAVAGLPIERFAVGGAIHQAIRQLGSVFGVALAVVLSTAYSRQLEYVVTNGQVASPPSLRAPNPQPPAPLTLAAARTEWSEFGSGSGSGTDEATRGVPFLDVDYAVGEIVFHR